MILPWTRDHDWFRLVIQAVALPGVKKDLSDKWTKG